MYEVTKNRNPISKPVDLRNFVDRSNRPNIPMLLAFRDFRFFPKLARVLRYTNGLMKCTGWEK